MWLTETFWSIKGFSSLSRHPYACKLPLYTCTSEYRTTWCSHWQVLYRFLSQVNTMALLEDTVLLKDRVLADVETSYAILARAGLLTCIFAVSTLHLVVFLLQSMCQNLLKASLLTSCFSAGCQRAWSFQEAWLKVQMIDKSVSGMLRCEIFCFVLSRIPVMFGTWAMAQPVHFRHVEESIFTLLCFDWNLQHEGLLDEQNKSLQDDKDEASEILYLEDRGLLQEVSSVL